MEGDDIATHIESIKHTEFKEKAENDAFCTHLLRISIALASENSATELINEKAKLLKKKAKKIKQVRLRYE